jgi:hypothetical protein
MSKQATSVWVVQFSRADWFETVISGVFSSKKLAKAYVKGKAGTFGVYKIVAADVDTGEE